MYTYFEDFTKRKNMPLSVSTLLGKIRSLSGKSQELLKSHFVVTPWDVLLQAMLLLWRTNLCTSKCINEGLIYSYVWLIVTL